MEQATTWQAAQVAKAVAAQHDESNLVTRARAGDAAAFDEIVALHRPRLVGLCTKWLNGDRHLAEDIAQEALVRAYRQVFEDERPLRLRAWLDTTARNACIDEHRRRRPHPVAEVPDMPLPGDGEPFLPDTSLVRAWGRLEDRQRDALRLREVDGRSYREIAVMLGLTMAATQGLIWRARSALRREYARVGGTMAIPPAIAQADRIWAAQMGLHASGTATTASQAAGQLGPFALNPQTGGLLGSRLVSALAPYLPHSVEGALAGLVALALSVAPLVGANDLGLDAVPDPAAVTLPQEEVPAPPPADVPAVEPPSEPAPELQPVSEPSQPNTPDPGPLRALLERAVPDVLPERRDDRDRGPVRALVEEVLELDGERLFRPQHGP